ncbi:cell wall metabolism sensor histidine kinase WalK [Paenibacillus doosanensis]|uniref:histidine kinase n=1 Tax=Paenibacillus konkukensis TaxID=2020716 RepID=A0ABY4RIG4_9BACL|nr:MULTISPECIES: ATP-binding protein [Paenibacillus]MCS7462429.1 cell wall metabolism sensor histidine kinase WalK [Paenibacillus doosanensis]UQZ81963.1 Sensor protein SrrB [Paenibacillus konkukensis]
MFILRSIVGKLWITIIGLVAVILMVLGLFLFQYIQTSFPKSQDQIENLHKLALKVSNGISVHSEDDHYIMMVNDLLSAQEATVFIVDTDFNQSGFSEEAGSLDDLHYNDFFSKQDMQNVFNGTIIDNQVAGKGGVKQRTNSLYSAVAVPLRDSAQQKVIGAAVLYQSTQSVEATQAYVMRLFAYVSMAGFLMTTFFAFFLLTRITQPLQQLRKAADLISHGEYGTRVPISSDDEIGELSKTFNRMGEELSDTIKALNHEKEHLSSVLRSMADAVITFDADGMVILTNPQGYMIVRDWNQIEWEEFDTDGGEEAGDGIRVDTIPAPVRPLFEQVINEAKEIATKLHVQNEVWSIVMAPLYSRDVVRGVVAVMRNVTEEFRLDKLRKDFVANVSHELRTPLSMLQGYSEALIDDIASSPEERKELAQVIHDESLRMGRLVRDLLDLAKMENGNLELHFREVDIAGFMRRMHRKFAVLSKEQDITMTCELPEGEPLVADADEDRLEQVMTNLLDNAIRHTPAGAQIQMKAAPSVYEGKEAVILEITDQGQGIPAGDLPYIFERFYKADKARTRGTTGGTGLGLSIVSNLVEAHRGTVQVKSAVGQGTTFTVILPKQQSFSN